MFCNILCPWLGTLVLSFTLLAGFPWQATAQAPLQPFFHGQGSTLLTLSKNSANLSAIERSLLSIYENNDFQPLWSTVKGTDPRVEVIIKALWAADKEGLNPLKYNPAHIQKLWGSRKPGDLAKLDILLSLGLGTYLADMHGGRTINCVLENEGQLGVAVQPFNPQELFKEALKAEDLQSFLIAQEPKAAQYQLLKKALADYRVILASGGWPTVPSGPTLIPGTLDQRLPLIVKRLQISGDLGKKISPTPLYNSDLFSAVKNFQRRHNLQADGTIGPTTIRSMNIPVEDRIRQITLNMERWRWRSTPEGATAIRVNIPSFQLQVFRDNKEQFSMPVIVGQLYNETPVLNDKLRYLVFNPYWTIPPKIAMEETLVHQQQDPGYLQQKNIRIFSGWKENDPEVDPQSIDWDTIGTDLRRYKLRQDPGSDNALGSIKFMFPNKQNIYLHDTPNHELFRLSRRNLSHGCVRVSEPERLAAFLLEKDMGSWNLKRVQQHIDSGQRRIVFLQKAVPVHLYYRTTEVDPATGWVFFYQDVYGKDARLNQSLHFTGQGQLCSK